MEGHWLQLELCCGFEKLFERGRLSAEFLFAFVDRGGTDCSDFLTQHIVAVEVSAGCELVCQLEQLGPRAILRVIALFAK